jgi:hypothetical protein
MKNGFWVIVLVALIVLGVFLLMSVVGANYPAILALFLGLVLARVIPWVLNMGFKNEIVRIEIRLIRWLRLKHENIIGLPDSVEDGVMYYKSRSRLPLKDLLNKIERRMEMLALSFTVIVQHIDDIRIIIAAGKQITFLALDPNSRYVSIHRGVYPDASNLRSQINTSLGALLELKRDYPDQVTIKI